MIKDQVLLRKPSSTHKHHAWDASCRSAWPRSILPVCGNRACIHTTYHFFFEFLFVISRAGPKHVGAHGQINNLAPLETHILWTFSAWGRASEQFWWRVPYMRIIFGEILSRAENLRLKVPQFRLFQWLLSAPLWVAAPDSCSDGQPLNSALAPASV